MPKKTPKRPPAREEPAAVEAPPANSGNETPATDDERQLGDTKLPWHGIKDEELDARVQILQNQTRADMRAMEDRLAQQMTTQMASFERLMRAQTNATLPSPANEATAVPVLNVTPTEEVGGMGNGPPPPAAHPTPHRTIDTRNVERLDVDVSISDFRTWREQWDCFSAQNRLSQYPNEEQTAALRGTFTTKMVKSIKVNCALDLRDPTLTSMAILNAIQTYLRGKRNMALDH
eukprot:snap_masked-scaffold3865_size7271-processed-gene-0.0 protein:Tk08426 transcript:snap_masked-scaffold3865_size7271-processed-gene-0.0-mRNA-1 annotation:"hypothetical protein DAPPUDRAFT_117723"